MVEDNPGDLLLLAHYLRYSAIALGKTSNATTLQGAISLLLHEKPDIIFLDLFLPDSTDFETFSIINEAAPSVPIIILSGLSDQEVALRAIQSGAQDFLIKGEFDEKILAKTIYYSIERKKIQESLNKSLERHELVANATDDVIWDLDIATNTLVHLSHAITTCFGYRKEDLDDTLEWWRVRIHPEDADVLVEKIRRIIKARGAHCTHEFRFKAGDGSYRLVYARALILYKKGDDIPPYRMVTVLQDITEIKALQKKMIRQKTINQQKITEAIIQSQEKQREELGRELHDNINQILATSKMFIDIALKNHKMIPDLLPKSFNYLNMAIEEIRKLSSSLVPPALDDIGMVEAIRQLMDASAHAQKVKYDLAAEGLKDVELPGQVQLMIYRIIQEQLTNITKYAGATEVSISLWAEKSMLRINISDNGAGFDLTKKSKGIGLRNIKNRAEVHGGKMKIITAPGKGCSLNISIPLKMEEKLVKQRI